MRQFTVLPHVADVRLKVEGSTLQELFTAALEGMNYILKKGYCEQPARLSERREIRISSFDTTALLVDFLSETLTLSLIHRAIFCQVKFAELKSSSLSAVLLGSTVSGFDEDIKAVSYHEAEIVQNSQGNYQTNVVFDI